MVTYQRRVESVCLHTTTCWGLLSHPSAKWRVLARRFNSRQGPFRIEGKVIHSTAQVFLPIGLLWWREGAGHRMSVQGWVTQGTPRTFLFALAWDLLVAAQSLLLNLQRIKIPSECCPNPLSVTPSWLCGKSSTWSHYWSASCTLILNTTLRLVSKPWKATCHSCISEVYSWCVGKCMTSPSCIIPRIRKCDSITRSLPVLWHRCWWTVKLRGQTSPSSGWQFGCRKGIASWSPAGWHVILYISKDRNIYWWWEDCYGRCGIVLFGSCPWKNEFQP